MVLLDWMFLTLTASMSVMEKEAEESRLRKLLSYGEVIGFRVWGISSFLDQKRRSIDI